MTPPLRSGCIALSDGDTIVRLTAPRLRDAIEALQHLSDIDDVVMRLYAGSAQRFIDIDSPPAGTPAQLWDRTCTFIVTLRSGVQVRGHIVSADGSSLSASMAAISAHRMTRADAVCYAFGTERQTR